MTASTAQARERLPTTFTTAEARAAGVRPGRLRAADLIPLSRGVHRWRDADVVDWADVERGTPHHGVDGAALSALLRIRPDAVLSHETAAHLHCLPFPSGGHTARTDVEITLPKGTRRARRPGVREHRRPLPAQHVTTVLGLRTTTAERTWLDLGSCGGPWNEAALVVAADHLVKHPWSDGARLPPQTTRAAIEAAMEPLGPFWGRARATAALTRVRVGADSPQETLLRLALVDAGLGEPLLQHRIEPEDRWCPEADLLYPDCRLVLQYDGATHRTAEQQASDAIRDQYFAERDHMTLHVTVRDARGGYARVIEAVRARRRRISRR